MIETYKGTLVEKVLLFKEELWNIFDLIVLITFSFILLITAFIFAFLHHTPSGNSKPKSLTV
jgi:hypothetical protein